MPKVRWINVNDPTKEWFGRVPKTCDVCEEDIGDYFVDGRTHYGFWAVMCVQCHQSIGCGLGIGNGQKYWKVPAKQRPEPTDVEEKLGIGKDGRMTLGAVLAHKKGRKLTS